MNERTPDEIRNEAMGDFILNAPHKYNKGQSEHGGNLDSVGCHELIKRAKEECIDQWFYLCSAEKAFLDREERWRKTVVKEIKEIKNQPDQN